MKTAYAKFAFAIALGMAAAAAARAQPAANCDKERYQRGIKLLGQVAGQSGESVVKALADYAPPMACMVVEFAYGDVFARPQLTLKQRELSTVAILAAAGNARDQLKVHIHAAFNVGLSREEIMETIIHTAVYAGFPAAINAIFAMKEVEEERGKRKTPR